MKLAILTIICLTIVNSCSLLKKKNSINEFESKTIDLTSPLDLELKGEISKPDLNRFHFHSILKSFASGEIRNQKEEVVDFDVKQNFISISDKVIKSNIETTSKEGLTSLHDLAMPELNENLEFIFTKKGEILKVGMINKESIFYVPQVYFPDKKVELGETWKLNKSWKNSQTGHDLEIDLVFILKKAFDCKGAICVELEVSGLVDLKQIQEKESQLTKFESEVKGYMWFNANSGKIIWSEMRTIESYIGEKTVVKGISCMASLLVDESFSKITQINCNPEDEEIIKPNL